MVLVPSIASIVSALVLVIVVTAALVPAIVIPAISIVPVLRVLDAESNVVDFKRMAVLGLPSLLVLCLPFSVMTGHMDALAFEEVRLQNIVNHRACNGKRNEICRLDAAVVLRSLPLLFAERPVYGNREPGLAHLALASIPVRNIECTVINVPYDTSFKITQIVYVSHRSSTSFLIF